MCLDAAVMGTCPTFINQSWKKGNSVETARRRGERGCRVNRRRREKESFRERLRGTEQGSY